MQQRNDLHNRVEVDFSYHPNLNEAIGYQHQYIRDELKALAHKLVDNLPASREQSLALTALEEAMHWSNAAIAKYQEKGE